MVRVLLSVIFLAGAAVAPAVTLQQLSIDEMTQSATAIVRARVAPPATGFSGRTIYTHYKLQVSEVLKGIAPAEVMVPGGVVGTAKQSFPGVPELQAGADYVLFLWTSPSTGITHLLGMQQGVFTVTGEDDSSRMAARGRIGETMLDRAGRVVTDTPVQIRLSDLTLRVRTTSVTGAAR